MLIANEKRNSDILEYILYMLQVQDSIRSCNFDMDLIKKHIVSKMHATGSLQEEIEEWYQSLVDMMITEGVKEKGYVSLLKAVMLDFEHLHQKLCKYDEHYQTVFADAQQAIESLSNKNTYILGLDTEIALYALYSVSLNKAQGKEVDAGTVHVLQTFLNFLKPLATYFHKVEKGEIESI